MRVNSSLDRRGTNENLVEFCEIRGSKIKKVSCHYLWDEEYVNAFKEDTKIHRKSAKTLLMERKIWTRCIDLDEHSDCKMYNIWKARHKKDHEDLCDASKESFRSVFVPGESKVLLNGKSKIINGGIKSCDPPCLQTASNSGPHPFTCKNCVKQKSYLKDMVDKRSRSALVKCNSSFRVGVKGFRTSYATKREVNERLDQLFEENQDLKKQVKKFEWAQFKKKTWEDMLLQSIEDNDIHKLAVDIVSLFQQPAQKGSVQFIVLQNLISKLKSKNNHKFTNIILDISSVLITELGIHNYSLCQNLFGLAGKTTAIKHSNLSKIYLGLNDSVFETAV